jgi:peptidoglycan-N-acetylglucosamine deacetylase
VSIDTNEREQLSPGLQRVTRAVDTIYQRLAGAITSVSTTEPIAALTFDDGPDPLYTPNVLRLLERYDARATFFMVGAAAYRHPGLVKQVAEAGHAIANHSWDHTSFVTLTSRQRRTQIRACQRVIKPYGTRLFRPPYGRQSVASHLEARLLGFQVVAWSLHISDWSEGDPEHLTAALTAGVRPGSIVLLHDSIFRAELDQRIQYDRRPLLQALGRFLDQQRGRFRWVTVPELLRRGRPVVREWYADDNW